MSRGLRIAIAVVVVIGLAAVGVFVVEEIRRTDRYGTEFAVSTTSGSRTAVEVGRGDRFSLVVRENASIGDKWSVRLHPALAVATSDGDEYVPDGGPWSEPRPGRGGARYFTFVAGEPGNSGIVLYNCYRCASAVSSEEAYPAMVDVTVRSW